MPSEYYEVLSRKGGYCYLYPEDVRRRKVRKHGCHGQEQTYFLCRLMPGAPEVNVNQRPREFEAYKWIKPEDFKIKWLPKFKRDVYRQVMQDFFNVEV